MEKPLVFNGIAIFDVFIVAKSSEAARDALLSWIRPGDLTPGSYIDPVEITATSVTRESAIRPSWQGVSPLVAADITDEEFAEFKGKTTMDIYNMLYKKRAS